MKNSIAEDSFVKIEPQHKQPVCDTYYCKKGKQGTSCLCPLLSNHNSPKHQQQIRKVMMLKMVSWEMSQVTTTLVGSRWQDQENEDNNIKHTIIDKNQTKTTIEMMSLHWWNDLKQNNDGEAATKKHSKVTMMIKQTIKNARWTSKRELMDKSSTRLHSL